LLDPWSTPHQISDDLESFFWVLLYQVVRYRDQKKEFTEDMADVFEQYESKNKVGLSRGGKGKLTVVRGAELSSEVVLSLTLGTPCSAIIEELRALFYDLYLFVSYRTLEPTVAKMCEKRRESDPRVQQARNKLQSSEVFLAILDKHLTSRWDTDDAGSVDISESLPDLTASRDRQKRPAEDSDDAKQNIHVRRRGRMPPKSTGRARDELSSQTSYTYDELFSSRVHISSGIPPSSSLRPSDGGPSAK